MNPYFIIEVASTHNGSMEYIDQLLKEFESFTGVGIKFQPFKFDMLAAEDYRGYQTYKDLYFDEKGWETIITKASRTKDIWLDLFDEYSIKILNANKDRIKGFKIQASVIGNAELFAALSKIDTSNKICMLNISAYEIAEIGNIIATVKNKVSCPIVLQIGFQSHPTDFADSGLVKLKQIRDAFPGFQISFADHLENNSKDVLTLPFVAALLGAEIIEKHVSCEKLPTKYDHYSSINYKQFGELKEMTDRYADLFQQPFISKNESEYLRKSLLVPLLKKDKKAGETLSLSDFDFKRTSKSGLDSFAIMKKMKEMYVLSSDLPAGSPVKQENLKKATIGAVVVCRMKSKRLPKKALQKVGGLTSIELCVKNTLQFENVNRVVLATSLHQDDEVLKDYTYSPAVDFFRGSEDDVIDRLIGIADKYSLDVIIRVTGDSPFRSNEVLQLLLKSHFEKGADYTAARNAALGTNTEIINVEALRKVIRLFNGAPHSEYMSYYFKNNPDYFSLNIVTLPEQFVNSFRLTLDYEEDLQLFRAIEEKFNYTQNDFDTFQLFRFLHENPKIAGLNAHCEVAYTPDSELMKSIIAHTTLKKTEA